MISLKKLIMLSKCNDFKDCPDFEERAFIAFRINKATFDKDLNVLSSERGKWKLSSFERPIDAKREFDNLRLKYSNKANFKFKLIDDVYECEFINAYCMTKGKLYGKITNFDIEVIKSKF